MLDPKHIGKKSFIIRNKCDNMLSIKNKAHVKKQEIKTKTEHRYQK